ncbi:hypothetical protein QBC32DRAFT_364679 [Pseudoneurospora amorphoporcata]|uniref:Uncharacterized protein n=1 Tax=Pseudoneurospora amorphoporcata TaxID=241081 RepID=A0AAN6NN31_9PEZI|nr:hypothetical protein QBC32DRAFT_364679 [Pseudoneurospora amorphoporcata]
MYDTDWEDPVTPTFDSRQRCPKPTTNSEAMFAQASKDTQKLLSISSELTSTRMELESTRTQVMNLKAADNTNDAVIQQLEAALKEERKKTRAAQSDSAHKQKETIQKLKEAYGKTLAEDYEAEHSHSVITALKLEVEGLRSSLDLTEQYRDETMCQNLDLQQRLDAMNEDVACMSELLQANEDLRWFLAEHKREIQRLHDIENKVERIDAIFKKSFQHADMSLINNQRFL